MNMRQKVIRLLEHTTLLIIKFEKNCSVTVNRLMDVRVQVKSMKKNLHTCRCFLQDEKAACAVKTEVAVGVGAVIEVRVDSGCYKFFKNKIKRTRV